MDTWLTSALDLRERKIFVGGTLQPPALRLQRAQKASLPTLEVRTPMAPAIWENTSLGGNDFGGASMKEHLIGLPRKQVSGYCSLHDRLPPLAAVIA